MYKRQGPQYLEILLCQFSLFVRESFRNGLRQLRRIDQRGDARQVTELRELGGGEAGFQRTATTDQPDICLLYTSRCV